MDKIVQIAPSKLELLRAAAEKQLSPEEYGGFLDLISQLQSHGLTPYINAQLGKLTAKIQWEVEVEESPEWAEALQACDRAFLGRELTSMCYSHSISPHGHKKELCRRLYQAKHPQVTSIMEPYLAGEKVKPARAGRYLETKAHPGVGISERLEQYFNTKYAEEIAAAEKFPHLELPSKMTEKLEEHTLTPKELDTWLSGLSGDKLAKAITTIKSNIADMIGDMLETYRYETEREGKEFEDYIDSLLEIARKHKI